MQMELRTSMSNSIKYILVAILFIGVVFYTLPRNNFEIIASEYNCEELLCSYNVTVLNSTSEAQSGYLKIKGEVTPANSPKSSKYFVLLNEKVDFKIPANKSITLTGSYKVKMRDAFLIFSVVSL